ncbi:hypothetical protein SBV1_1870006 [Verrucomicrobia bacterium]|nr:hypothetical protein SBV1_1870006 [Verrucomicrobiota bacterium]
MTSVTRGFDNRPKGELGAVQGRGAWSGGEAARGRTDRSFQALRGWLLAIQPWVGSGPFSLPDPTLVWRTESRWILRGRDDGGGAASYPLP